MTQRYAKVPTDLRFVEREKATVAFWKEQDIFKKSVGLRAGCPHYAFYEGPPTANGKPHIGHVLTRVIKDAVPRYQTMKGRQVLRKAGWDTHGLPVELEVERSLGINGKEQIEAYGLAAFVEKCKESVWKYREMWEDFSGTVGFWADMDTPYVTYHNDYIESVWWSLKQIWDRGLLYRGFKIVPYCPRCGTPLSSHEVAQGYQTVKETSATVKFAVKDKPGEYLLAWTTTPWTLPSNLALCVNPRETYVRAAVGDQVYLLAEARLNAVLGEGATVLERFPGKTLEGLAYQPLFDFIRPDGRAFFVTCDGYVTLDEGTGVVHIAPAFGEDDARVGRAYELPFVQLVNEKGEMTADTPWAGTFCKDADPLILQQLQAAGLLFATLPFSHEYPHCWRCGTPLIYYARNSWFIRMSAVKDRLIAHNKTINWIPEHVGRGRFGDWIENVQDWSISRDRYWGTPLNIWECACGERQSIGSIRELREKSPNCPAEIELHRPFIDEVTLTCPACGGQMRRVKEVIDCWYDSGSMPFAQWHYPFENKEMFEQQFPADFISEAVDQTRGWFYSLLAISTLVFDTASFRNVMVLGHVLDENGQKMSKSKGNAVDPFEALETYGADAIRWYFYANSAPWLPNRFSGGAVLEGQRNFMGTLWNTYAFFVLYANIDGFDATRYTLDYPTLSVMDKWLLSRLHSLIRVVDGHLDNYRLTEAARALEGFVDELSNWYVRRCRERFWAGGMTTDKINAYMTLYTTLVTLAKLAAPLVPFMTEDIYRNLVCSLDKNAPESVHLCDYPRANPAYIDPTLETRMEELLSVVVLGRACRNNASLKIRQPLAKLYVKADFTLPALFNDIIRDELNVEEVLYADDVRRYTSYAFKPQLKTVGPKYGPHLPRIREWLSGLDGNAAMDELNQTGTLTLALGDAVITLAKEDLLIATQQLPGFMSASDKGVTVVLDTNLTPRLIEGGFVRELVSKLQTMRKDSGFEVTDRIKVGVSGNDTITAILGRHARQVCEEVLADEILFGCQLQFAKEWDINGELVTLSVVQVR